MTKLHSRMYGWKYVWMEFADEYKASVDDPDPDSSHTEMSLVVPISDSAWSLVYTMHPSKQAGNEHTTIETCYTPADDFKFAIHPEKWTDGFQKMLGMQDIIIGHEEFDKSFIIKGNDEQRVKDLFSDAALRRLILDEPTTQLWAHVENSEKAPAAKALRGASNRSAIMRVKGAVDDFERLKSFYNLKYRLLKSLQRIGAASN